jgi:hypothetical protein
VVTFVQLPNQCLMSRPQPPLHCLLLRRIHVISGAIHLLICVAEVALVGLDPITRLKEVRADFLKNFNIHILTGRVGTLDPRQAPCEYVGAQLVAQGGLHHS